MPKVSFDDIAEVYNRSYGTRLSTAEYIRMAYEECGSVKNAAMFSGMSEPTYRKAMIDNGIPTNPKHGGRKRWMAKTLKETLSSIDPDELAAMTVTEISEVIGSRNEGHTRYLLKTMQLPWRRINERRPDNIGPRKRSKRSTTSTISYRVCVEVY